MNVIDWLLVPCPDHHAVNLTVADACRWMQQKKIIHVSFELAKLSDIEPGFVCKRCGKRGAEVRPKLSTAGTGTG